MPPRIKAFLLLAFALLRTFFRRAVGGGRSGLAAFRANYAADGLAPVSPDERRAMEGFGRCIACGLCDRGERERIARSGGAYQGVMALMVAASRSMPDFGAAALAFRHVTNEVLAQKERRCPTHVPMRAVAAFVRGKSPDARVSLRVEQAPPR